ncbi:periplasmic nitrate reductase, NapE protein [Azospirillum picis]|uniref:Nitrate reductase NapE n=1 Tax=Azospirillum picis TaxID=488438 RepID=A0ABU0MJW5_9PROT|nr:periplasmic nitrate reductase, NapE protein [Azospirillum picis]MBP2300032.1 nitrate reductase NapE [Azospirillum picis]MDQ0533730.1 nitrate reductase NapE [Azospirillum picis]
MRYTPSFPDQTRQSGSQGDIAPTRRAEGLMFLWLAVLVWPLIAVGSVAAYGFSIWMYQLLTH